jgi:hypothetical protein
MFFSKIAVSIIDVLLDLLVDDEDGGNTFSLNVGWLLPNYTAYKFVVCIITAVRTSNPANNIADI